MDGVGTYFFDNGNYFDGRMKDGLPEGGGSPLRQEGEYSAEGTVEGGAARWGVSGILP